MLTELGVNGSKRGAVPVPDSVSFSNPFFTFCEDITFEHRDGDDHPVMVVPMAEQAISMHFPGVIRELSLKEDDSDYVMLDIIAQSLDFVCMLRVGDPIPSEITNGQASWKILERHRVTARHRLMLKLISWITGTDEQTSDPKELAVLMEKPENKNIVDEAFISIAEALGYEKDQKEEVVSLVELLAEELSYIEALREIYHEIKSIQPILKDLTAAARFDDFMRDNANSVTRLIGEATREYAQEFLQLDAQTGEIIAVLKNVKSQIQFIRQMRDGLARRLLAWDGLERKWRDLNKKNRSAVDEVLVETYRFLALRFLPAVNWKLVTQALDEHANETEAVW